MAAKTVLKQVNKRKTSENPFFQMKMLLHMYQELPKVDDATVTQATVNQYLDYAWAEAKDNKEKRELFMSILFSIGDITNREHNLYRLKSIRDVENGGHSKRRTFIFCLVWLASKLPEQFYRFLPIIGEYYNLDGVMLYELRTDRFKGNLKEILKVPVDINKVTDFIAAVLKNPRVPDNQKFMWAKWLPHVPETKRRRKYVITEKNVKAFQKGGHSVEVGSTLTVTKGKKQHTLDKDQWVRNFIFALSQKMDWAVIQYPAAVDYKGYREFKKKYLGMTEAHLFSSKKILDFDKVQFMDWLSTLPSGARYAVQRRVLDKDKKTGKFASNKKWVTKHSADLGELMLEWTKGKEQAQKVVRELTPEKIEQLKKEDPNKLKEIQKAAKVNTGADSILDVMAKVLKNTTDEATANIEAHSLLEKVKIDVPVLVIADVSGSMSSRSVLHKGITFTAKGMAQLATTLFMLKNPEPELSDMFIRFDDVCEVICTGTKAIAAGSNRFLASSSTIVPQLIDKTKTFGENLRNVSQYVISRNGTSFNCVATGLKSWVDAEPALKSQRTEQINKYPVFLVISDGDFNSHSTPAASLQDFQMKMKQWFGWNGVVVVWDVHSTEIKTNKFDGLENVLYFGGCNIGILNQVFTNISDLDIIDVYLPLLTTHSSNRYQPVRELTT